MEINKCQNYGSTNIKDIPTNGTSIHYAKIVCNDCKHFCGWQPFPKTEGMHRKFTASKKINDVARYHKYNTPFCFLCLRKKEQLGLYETLTIDHIHELRDGGSDSIENAQILCTACHQIKNWLRLYLNCHKKREADEDGNTKSIEGGRVQVCSPETQGQDTV